MKVKKQGWINIVRGKQDGRNYCALLDIHQTKMQAEEVKGHLNLNFCDYIATIQIEWEEEE